MKEFYIYLPSNTDFLPENKAAKYTTKLAKDMSLGDGWECALKEIHYPKSWKTLTKQESRFMIFYKNDNSYRELRMTPGYYTTEDEVIAALNKVVKSYNILVEKSTSMEVIVLNIPKHLSLHFTEPLSSMLGLGHGELFCNNLRLGEFSINLTRGIDSIYVYTDIVQTKLVGNADVPLLSVVPLSGSFGEMYFKEYVTPVYTPISKTTFSTIEIYITDSAGREIPFTSGKVTVLLHFRKNE